MINLIYITAPSKEESMRIGKQLLNERIAACINIFPQMHSVYLWDGALEESEESVLIVKTDDSYNEKVRQRVQELHPYNTPCIISLPVSEGNEPYLKWLQDQLT